MARSPCSKTRLFRRQETAGGFSLPNKCSRYSVALQAAEILAERGILYQGATPLAPKAVQIECGALAPAYRPLRLNRMIELFRGLFSRGPFF